MQNLNYRSLGRRELLKNLRTLEEDTHALDLLQGHPQQRQASGL